MKWFGRSIRPAFAVAALLGTACTGSGPLATRSGADGPPPEVRELRARVIELQRRAAVTEVELERLRRQVAELEARMEGRPVPQRGDEPARSRSEDDARAAPVEPVIEIEDVGDERPAPGRSAPPAVEEPSGRPGSVQGRPEPASPPAPAGGDEEPAGQVTPDAQELYDRGYTLYHQQRYVDAESTFRRFIQSYPDTELTDNARYWIGESRLARGDVRGALAAFRETVERHPRGNKVPDALLKVGEAMGRIGDSEGAREAYQEVIRRFAGTAAASVARDRLEQLP